MGAREGALNEALRAFVFAPQEGRDRTIDFAVAIAREAQFLRDNFEEFVAVETLRLEVADLRAQIQPVSLVTGADLAVVEQEVGALLAQEDSPEVDRLAEAYRTKARSASVALYVRSRQL